ncbi:MAG TPA: VanW family protein [Chloroflexota bacterium]|nr:VanW family protein [Chloroflexota bacterium]
MASEQRSIGGGRATKPWFWIAVALGALVAICLLAIVVDSAIYYGKVHSGVRLSGVDVGGKTRDQATAALNALVQEAESRPITIAWGDKSWAVMPEDGATRMDVEAAVNTAMQETRKNGFLTDILARWRLYFSARDFPLTGSVDKSKLAEFVAGVAKQVDIEPVNAGLRIEKTSVKVVDSVEGKAVDQAALIERLSNLLATLQSTTVDLPVATKEPEVTAEDNAEAQKQAETMISGPVRVSDGAKTWTLGAEDIASYMTFKSEIKNGVSTLVPYLDASGLQPLLDEIAPAVAKEPVDASFASDGGKAWVVPGKNGQRLDPDATAEAITAATLSPINRKVQIVLSTKEPALTTAEAEAMGLKEKLASYTTRYVGSPDRQANVRKATEYGTNVFLAPGEIYDTDKQFGPRTPARGYRLAPGITGPNTLEDVLGGGICQVSTTLFNAVFFAGLDVVERWNHSIYIDHYPKGRDATVTGGGKNLRFKNDTGHYVWIRGTSDGITTTITIYGTNDGRKVSFTTSDFYNVKSRTVETVADPSLRAGRTLVVDQGQTGRSVKVVRTVTRADGRGIHKDSFVSTWLMYPKEIRVGTATTASSTSTTTPTSILPSS